jgi:hypothetical protein
MLCMVNFFWKELIQILLLVGVEPIGTENIY